MSNKSFEDKVMLSYKRNRFSYFKKLNNKRIRISGKKISQYNWEDYVFFIKPKYDWIYSYYRFNLNYVNKLIVKYKGKHIDDLFKRIKCRKKIKEEVSYFIKNQFNEYRYSSNDFELDENGNIIEIYTIPVD